MTKAASERTLLQWYISAVSRCSMHPARELARRLLAADPVQVGNAYDGRNSDNLYKAGTSSRSLWKKVTLPSAEMLESAPAPIVAELVQKYGNEDFFGRLQKELRRDFIEKRQEYADPLFAESRMKVWLDLLSLEGQTKEQVAHALVQLFVEIVLSMEEGGSPRGGGDALLAELLCGRAAAAEPDAQEKPVPEEVHPKNIRMLARKKLEKEKENLIADRLRGAVKVRMLNITAIGLIDGHENPNKVDYKRGIFEECLESGTRFEVVLPKPGSIAELDAGTYKLRQGYIEKDGMTMIRNTREALIRDLRNMKSRQAPDETVPPITLYFTEGAIPYALMIVTFNEDEEEPHALDHVKVDLLSPYLSDDLTRRSFFVSRAEDPDNYNFFVDNYTSVMRNSIPYADDEE